MTSKIIGRAVPCQIPCSAVLSRIFNEQSRMASGIQPGTGYFFVFEKDSAEKPYECFDEAQHERKISNDFTRSSVRPKVLEG
jgi:hypothetical protein